MTTRQVNNAACRYCKKQGHIISTCPKLARINSTEKCHFCHENGHSVRTCPTLIERDEEAKESLERFLKLNPLLQKVKLLD